MGCRLWAAHLVGSRHQAANPVVIVGVDRVEVEAEHQVPALHHYQLVTLVLHHAGCHKGSAQPAKSPHAVSRQARQAVDAHEMSLDSQRGSKVSHVSLPLPSTKCSETCECSASDETYLQSCCSIATMQKLPTMTPGPAVLGAMHACAVEGSGDMLREGDQDFRSDYLTSVPATPG